MRFIALVPLALALLGGRAQAEPLKVVATVPDLAAIASAVGGNLVTVKSLTLPSQDPHFADAKPSLALELNRAKLLLHVGLDLEVGWLPTLVVGARNPALQPGSPGNLDCSQFVTKLDVPKQAVDRSQGDIHPGGNPHYLFDPRAAAKVAAGVAERLATLDPDNAAAYRENNAAFARRLEAARIRWEKRLAPARGATFISYHRTFSYLADWLGLVVVGFLEPKPGVPPNPRHIAGLLGLGRSRQVKMILLEDHYPDSTARLLAERVPAPLARVPAGTHVNKGESYLQHFEEVLEPIAAALEARK